MSFSKAKYVTVCQQFLVTAAVLAVGLSAAGVVTLQIVSPQDVQTPSDAQSAVKIEDRPAPPAPVQDSSVDVAPVQPKIREVAVTGVDPSAKTLPATGDEPTNQSSSADRSSADPSATPEKAPAAKPATKLAAVSAPTKVTGYGTVGVTWSGAQDIDEKDIAIQVRTKKDGAWSRWSAAEYHDDHGPDLGSSEGRAVRPGTDALVIGDVDEVQMRAETATGAVPAGMKLAVIDPGAGKLRKEAPAIDTAKLPSAQKQAQKQAQKDAQGGAVLQSGNGDQMALSAMKAAPKPLIYSRAQWGANESIREQTPPSYGTIKTGFVHHTVNANDYTADQVPALIRGIYAYHVQSRGWRDIGYNFLVDRFGRIWEGRWGGVDKAVVGAHTLGYNEQSFAGSAIGNWDIATPPPAVADAFSRLMAWKLSLYNIPADAVHIWVKDKYFNAINGHRDAGSTACPGRYLYAQLPTIRSKAKAIQNAAQTGTPPPPPGPAPLARPVTPLRVLDTRTGTGGVSARAVGANSTVTFTVTGKGAIPATGVAGVFLNVTATESGAAGYVTAYPAGTTRPTASSLNTVAGETRPNMVFVPVGTGADAGKVTLFNGSPSTVDLIADTAGYVLAAAAGKPGAATSVKPARVVDTRSGIGAAKAAVPAKGAIDVTIAGKGGVPATGAAGVWINVTAVDPTAAGYVTVSPGGQTTNTSNLNFAAGQTAPNLVFVPLSGGKVRLYNGSTGKVQLVVDTAGYTVAGTPVDAGAVSSVPPARVLDTRIGTGAARAALQPGGVVTLKVRGRGNIPDSSSIAGVFLNVTATSPTKEGYITVYPAGTARPNASNLNYLPGRAIPNLVFAPINSNGEIQLYNGSTGTVHLVADTAGYIKGTPTG